MNNITPEFAAKFKEEIDGIEIKKSLLGPVHAEPIEDPNVLHEKIDLMQKAIDELAGRFMDYFGATQAAVIQSNMVLRKASDSLKTSGRHILAKECANRIAVNDAAIGVPLPDGPTHWVRQLRVAVGTSGELFRTYEQMHLAKTPPDTEKAKRNADAAARCETAITAMPGEWKPKSMGGL